MRSAPLSPSSKASRLLRVTHTASIRLHDGCYLLPHDFDNPVLLCASRDASNTRRMHTTFQCLSITTSLIRLVERHLTGTCICSIFTQCNHSEARGPGEALLGSSTTDVVLTMNRGHMVIGGAISSALLHSYLLVALESARVGQHVVVEPRRRVCHLAVLAEAS